jgi:type IV pilus assembly protein PilX
MGRRLQSGASLIVTLLMLLAVLMLGSSAAQMALQDERARRNERDRAIAFEAAEAALLDAELDIGHSPDPARSRSTLFSRNSAAGFPPGGSAACAAGVDNPSLGLCASPAEGGEPAWQTVDFDNRGSTTMQTVPFGRFTGQRMQTGRGYSPGEPPRYVIELLVCNRAGERADKPGYMYRVTAIGYGPRHDTQVVLQSVYRKES